MIGGPLSGAPQVLLPRRLKYVLIAAGAFVFALFGLVLGFAGDWAGWLIAGFAALVGAVGLMALSPRFMSLQLDGEGFTVRSMFRVRRYRWGGAANFRVAPVHLAGRRRSDAVVFDLAPAGPQTRIGQVRGWDDFVPDGFGRTPAELAALLQRHRDSAGPKRHTSGEPKGEPS